MNNEQAPMALTVITKSGNPPLTIDLISLCVPELTALSLIAGRKMLANGYQVGQVCPQRLGIVRKLHVYLQGNIESGIFTQLYAYKILALAHKFLRFTDHEILGGVKPENIIEALSKYNLHWTNKYRSGVVSKSHAANQVNFAIQVFCESVGHSYVLAKAKISPIRNPGSGKHRERKNSDSVGFSKDLKNIIDSISVDNVLSTNAIEITLRERDDYLEHKQFLCRESSVIPAGIQPPFLNVKHINLRIIAEVLRFILACGINLEVARNLKREDVLRESFSGRYIAVGFKNRKGGTVKAELPKAYERCLREYLGFLTGLSINDDNLLLFPMLAGRSSNYSKPAPEWVFTEAFNDSSIRGLFKKAGRPYLGPQALRYNLGDFAHRKTGDPLMASQILGNSAVTAAKSYGGRGNRTTNEHEMTLFFQEEVANSTARLTLSTDPGLCKKPNSPDPSVDTPKGLAPTCGADNSCFDCKNYRAIASTEYMHALLTRRHDLLLRDGIKPHPQTQHSIDRINGIISRYKELSPEHSDEVRQLISLVEKGKFHRLFKNEIEIKEVLTS